MPKRAHLLDTTEAVLPPASLKAGWSALLYIVLCIGYIHVSSHMAASIAQTTEQLQRIEAIKGTAFVVITGLIFFAISYARWRQIQRQQRVIHAREQSLMLTESKVVAAVCTATMAHDLNNLLMALQGTVAALREREEGDAFVQKLRQALESNIDSLSLLATRIASTAKHAMPEEKTTLDLADVLPKLAALVQTHPDVRACSLRTAVVSHSVRLNKALLTEAVTNLIVNAAQATGPQGTIELRTAAANGTVALEVHDDGPGIPEERRSVVFDPSFTTKADGTGIGLLSVKAFASSCNATVQIGDSDLGGAMFRIRIPLRTEAAGDQGTPEPQ